MIRFRYLTLALTNLRRHRLRALIGVAGIAFGVAAMLAILAVVHGAIGMFERILNTDSDYLVFERKVSDLFFSSVTPDQLAAVRARPEVAEAHPMLFGIVSAEDHPVVTCFGIEAADPRLRRAHWLSGSPERFGQKAGEIFLGSRAAEFLEARAGDTVEIGRGEFTVGGVFRTENGFEDGGVFLPLKEAQAFFHREDTASIVAVKLRDAARGAEFKAALEAAEPGVMALENREFSRSYNSFKILHVTAWAVGLCAFVLGGLGVANTMLLSVFGRIRELAVQSANATNSASDRSALNAEVNQLVSEIDRVAKQSEFNGTKLLDGSFLGQLFQVGANAGQAIAIQNTADARASALGGAIFDSFSTGTDFAGTATAAGTIAGISVSGGGLSAAVVIDDVAIANGDTAAVVAGKVVAAINAKIGETGLYASANGADITFTSVRESVNSSGAFTGFAVNFGTLSGGTGLSNASNIAATTVSPASNPAFLDELDISTVVGAGQALAIVDKRRERPGESEVMNIIGEVEGRSCILVDDIVDSGGTLVNAAEALLAQGAKEVYAYITHGVLSGGAVSRIASSKLKELVITDSIQPTEAVKVARNIRVLTIAPLIGEAIGRTATEASVSSLFD